MWKRLSRKPARGLEKLRARLRELEGTLEELGREFAGLDKKADPFEHAALEGRISQLTAEHLKVSARIAEQEALEPMRE